MPSSLARSRDNDGTTGENTDATGHPGSTGGPDPTTRVSSVEGSQLKDGVSENSPLLSPAGEDDAFIDNDTALEETDDDEYQTTKSVWYLILLTLSIGGLQIAWCVELSNGSPYLLSLGLTKSLMALVWIAGPLSGTLVQPYIGMLSDNCRVSWGKRKPFMVIGTVATIVSLMILAWTKEMVAGFLGLFGADPDSRGVKVCVIITAVIWVYVLDFAINVVQAAIRAFIVDCAPAHQQEAANSMASRITGVGNIIGYVAGYVDLTNFLGFLGNSQFKDLCALASFCLALTVGISCVFIRERDPRAEGPPPADKPGVLSFFHKIFVSIKRLPPQIKKVCTVQFFAWIGYFPMLFYTTQYIAEIYAEPYLEENPNMTPEQLDELYERATRVGTFALLIYSIVSLVTNVFLPFCIAPTYDSQPIIVNGPGDAGAAAGGAGGDTGSASSIKDFETEKKHWLDYLIIPGFTLRRAWMLSLLLFTASMLCTVFVRTVAAATALIGLVGITWALTLWAPWAIISAEISRRDAVIRAQRRQLSPNNHHDSSDELPTLDGYSDQHRYEEEVDQAGVILGIHNMAIACPQFIGTFVSSIIFRFFQKPRGTPGDHSIAIVLALGGLTMLVAAYFVHLIEDAPAVAIDAYCAIEEGDGVEETRPGMRSRTQSFERPRASLERATLARQSSFGGGLEY